MICKNCGKEIVDDAGFCSFCGASVGNNGVHLNEQGTLNEKTDGDLDASEDNTPENDIEISLLGHHFKGRLIMRIASVIAIICFFCPMFLVSCSGVEITEVSMSDLMFGSDDTGDNTEYYDDYYDDTSESAGSEKCIGMVVFLLMPLSAFGTCMISKAEKGWGQEAANLFGSTALGLLLAYQVAYNSIASSEYAYYGLEITPTFAFYLYLLACIIGMCMGIKVAKAHNEYMIINAEPGKNVKKNYITLKTVLCSIGGAFLVYIFYYILNQI